MSQNNSQQTQVYSLEETRDLIKQVLREQFPETRFLVTSRRQSGKVLIRFTDGPSEFTVSDLCYRYADGRGEDLSVVYLVTDVVVYRTLSENYLNRVATVYCQFTENWTPPIDLTGKHGDHAYIQAGHPLKFPIMKLARHLGEKDLETLPQTLNNWLQELNITIDK